MKQVFQAVFALMLAAALALAPAAAETYTTPGGTGVNPSLGMCVNGSSQAVPCSSSAALPSTRNVDTGALITLTAASSGVNSADQTNLSGRGINLVIDVTAISGTSPTLTVTLQGKDTASGQYYTILASAALTATGVTVLQVFPGAAVTANVSANAQLPRTWRISTAIGGTTPSVTATIGASVIE